MAVDFDVVVDVYPHLFPFGVDVRLFRQRLQGGLVDGFEGRAARTGQLLEGPLIEPIQQYADRCVEFAQGEKLAIAQDRQDPALDHLHTNFNLVFVLGFSGSRGQHRYAVMLGQITVTGIDVRLVAMRFGDATAQIVRHQNL